MAMRMDAAVDRHFAMLDRQHDQLAVDSYIHSGEDHEEEQRGMQPRWHEKGAADMRRSFASASEGARLSRRVMVKLPLRASWRYWQEIPIGDSP
jgi:hypothetical protein